MSNIQVFNHPSGDKLIFDQDKHSYYMHSNIYQHFISGTTFIKGFFPEFDVEKVSEIYATKYNLDQEEVKRQWKAEGDKGLLLGNLCHNYIDALLKDKSLPKPKTQLHKQFFKVSKTMLKHIFRDHQYLFSEYGIASPNWNVAGMLDCSFRKNNILDLVDWKTSKIINEYNTFQSGFFPINHLDDCNFNHYALQLNLYKFILKEEHYIEQWFKWCKQVRMSVYHIQYDKWTRYTIPDMSKEIKRMLKYRMVN